MKHDQCYIYGYHFDIAAIYTDPITRHVSYIRRKRDCSDKYLFPHRQIFQNESQESRGNFRRST